MVARMISTSLQRDFAAPYSAARRAARDRFKLIEVTGGNTLYGRSSRSWRRALPLSAEWPASAPRSPHALRRAQVAHCCLSLPSLRPIRRTSPIYLFERGLLSQDPDMAAAFQQRAPGRAAGRARGLVSVPNQHAATHDLRWPSYDKAFSGHSHSLRVALRSRLPVNYPLRRPTGRRRSFRVHAIPLRGQGECVLPGGCGGSSSPDPGQLHPATGAGQ